MLRFCAPALLTACLVSACSANGGTSDGTDPSDGIGASAAGSTGNGASGAVGNGGGGTNVGASGSANSNGGASSTGGASSIGGASSTGGASSIGGASSTGGASPIGGATGSAGSAGHAGSTSSGGSTSSAGASSTGGAGSAGASSSTGGSAGTGTGTTGPSEPSGMPIPTTSGVPKPSGTPGNFSVLNWAGFKAAASFSFDDALSSQISNYAALQGTGVHLTFYLVSNNNPTSSTWSQAEKDGHELGNHTAHHCHDDGTGCAWGTYAGSLGAELDQCTAHITATFGASDVWTAAAPYGDAGYDTPDSTRFLINRGVQGGSIGANDGTNPFQIPCHLAAEGEVAATFNAATDAARSAGKWQVYLVHSLGGDGGYNPVSITDVVAAINHAKTVGDTWADTVMHVGAYWRAQKLVSGLTPTTSGSSKTWSWTLPAHFPPGRYLRVAVSGGTLTQGGTTLAWSQHGYYEVALDAGSVTLSP